VLNRVAVAGHCAGNGSRCLVHTNPQRRYRALASITSRRTAVNEAALSSHLERGGKASFPAPTSGNGMMVDAETSVGSVEAAPDEWAAGLSPSDLRLAQRSTGFWLVDMIHGWRRPAQAS